MGQKRQSASQSALPKTRRPRPAKTTLTTPALSEELSHTLEQAKQLLYSQEVATSALAQPLAELTESTMPQPAWIIPELLPVGVTVLAGLTGVGKSVFALNLALAVAENAVFLNRFPVEQGDVLYLGLEDSQRTFHRRVYRFLQRATLRFEQQQGEPGERPASRRCEWAGKWHLLHTGGLADLEDWLELHPQARLLVIDSMVAVRPLLEKKKLLLRNDPILFPLHSMAHKYHIAIVLIYHLHTYDMNSVSDLMHRASQAMIDGVMLLRRDVHLATARLTLNGKDICEQEFVLTFEPHYGYCLAEPSDVYSKK